jgi:beta-glucosidase
MLGGWSALGSAEDVVTILDGIREAVGSETTVLHSKGADVIGEDRSLFNEAVSLASVADAVVMVLGEHRNLSAEAYNRSSLDLPGVQQELAEAIQGTGKPVVAVLANGRPLSITYLAANVPAILETWFLGVEAGHAVADVLFGDVNPSGKLPATFPRTVGQVPIYYNHKNTGRPPDPNDRFTSKYLDVHWTPLFPFGHGLSYTTFGFSNLTVSATAIQPHETVTVQVDVQNTGEREGREVVQLYIRDEVASVTRPVKELRGFESVVLAPGETQTISFRLSPDDLSLLDLDLVPVVEPGFFTVFVGGSSEGGLQARFEVLEST